MPNLYSSKNFRCLFTASLDNDCTQEVFYRTAAKCLHQDAPSFSVTASLEGLLCTVPEDTAASNPTATKLFKGSKATLCIASKGSEHTPQFGADHQVQYDPLKNSSFICMLAPSAEIASSMATQMRIHKSIGVYIEFAASQDDFAQYNIASHISIPVASISITFYNTNPSILS